MTEYDGRQCFIWVICSMWLRGTCKIFSILRNVTLINLFIVIFFGILVHPTLNSVHCVLLSYSIRGLLAGTFSESASCFLRVIMSQWGVIVLVSCPSSLMMSLTMKFISMQNPLFNLFLLKSRVHWMFRFGPLMSSQNI